MKTAVCAIVKLENHYIKEWAEYYKALGFNHIFIYDNNDINGEDVHEPIKDLNYITIIDVKGKVDYQVNAYNDCYQNYGKDFDWILFVDIDEYLTFTDGTMTINKFLENPEFNNYKAISFSWQYYDDNNQVKVLNNNYSLLNRFTHRGNAPMEDASHKQLVKTKQDVVVNSISGLRYRSLPFESNEINPNKNDVTSCDSIGQKFIFPKNDGQIAFIRHFRYKTIEEYLNFKAIRGYPIPLIRMNYNLDLKRFFSANKLTKEKINYIKEWLATADVSQEYKNKIQQELECL